MRFAFVHKASSYLMVATAFGAAYFGGEVHGLVGAVFLLALGASWYWEASFVDREVLVPYWNAATLAAFAYTMVVIVVYEGDVIINAFNFLVFLQTNKLFNRRGSKDYMHLYVLSFLMLTLATTVNTELNYALWFALYLVFTTWTLILFHLKREMEDNYLLKHSEDASRSRKVEVQRILNSRRIVGVPFLAVTSGISLIAFILSVGIFFAFPRVGFGLFFANRRAGTPIAGFSDHVELGDFGLIKDNPRVVMRVKMDRAPLQLDGRAPRWRGATYDTYNGHVWSRDRKRRRHLQKLEGRYHLFHRPSTNPVVQTIYLEPLDTKVLFGLDRPDSVQIHDGPKDLPQGAIYEVRANRYDDMLLTVNSTLQGTRISKWADPDNFVSNPAVHYTVWSGTTVPSDETINAQTEPLPRRLRRSARRFLQVPATLSPKVRELAEQIVREAGAVTTMEKARAVQTWLRHGSYAYTTNLERDESMAPLEDFLFVQKKGHCEYFATAQVVLLRTLGIPARYVSGFLGGRWNPYGNYHTVTHGDAHSWAEVHFYPFGWMTFEATPPAADILRQRTGVLSRLAMYVDAMRLSWYRYVIEYDLNKQFSVMRWLRAIVPRGFGDSGRVDTPTRRLERLVRERPGALVGGTALVGLLLAGLFYWLRRRRQILSGGRPLTGTAHRGAQLYLHLLRVLQGRGHDKRLCDTALEFLAQVKTQGTAEEAEVTDAVTARYLDARFGDVPLSPEEVSLLTERVRSLTQSPPASP